jgi:rare lipoprotein A
MPISKASHSRLAQPAGALLLAACAALLLASCSSQKVSSRYSQRHDSAPGAPVDVSHVKDAVPRDEPRSRWGNPPSYVVNGRRYHTLTTSSGYRERGIASWYGTKFHGHRTSSGETYDMYRMSAAHKSLPLPTYARVTNLRNKRSVIVKVNDRGPFHDNRIIDLSYAAAAKLGILGEGTGLVEVEAIDPQRYAQHRQPQQQPLRNIHASQPKVSKLALNAVSRDTPAAVVTDAAVRLPAVAAPETDPGRTADPVSVQPSLYLQVGAFRNRSNAERLRSRLGGSGLPGELHISEGFANEQRVYRVRFGPLASVESADELARQLAEHGIPSPRVVID